MDRGINRVRVGLVGCGTIATVLHLPGLRQMEELGKVEVVAVCDTIAAKARAAAETFQIPHAYDDLDRMLAEVEFELLVNTTPIPEHAGVSLAALRAGRHVYTQKPLATTLADANHLIDEARARGLKLACAPEHPVRPIIQEIGRLVQAGAIGKVTFARVQSSHDGPEKHDVPRDSTWFYQPGSNPILDLGVHGLSQITAILGPVQRLSCFSGRSLPVRVTTAGPFKGKPIAVEIDDNSLLLLDFGDARFAFLDATYCVAASLGPSLEIHGTEGTLAVVGPGGATASLQLYESRRGAWREVPVPSAPPVKDLGVLHLVDVLREGGELLLTGERGRHLVEVMVEATRAATEGRVLPMETTF